MASKLKSVGLDRNVCLFALLGLFVGVLVSSCFHGLQTDLDEEDRDQFKETFVNLQGMAGRGICNSFITLSIKFLHFFVSKCLQFRYLSPMQAMSSTRNMLFWVAFTRSISSMSD